MEERESKVLPENVNQEVLDADYEISEEQQCESYYPMRQSNRTVLIVLLVVIFGLVILLFQKGKMVELQDREANAQAQIILLQEESLHKYGIMPEMIPELFDLREKWFNDHSSKSAKDYSEALEMVLDYLEKYSDVIRPPESIDSPKTVVVEL